MAKLTEKEKFLALLFRYQELSKKELEKQIQNWKELYHDLKKELKTLGLELINAPNVIKLALSNNLSGFLQEENDKELKNGDLTDSASQVLSLILHCAPISKFEIDYLRGVNSASSLKRLELQGLTEKKKDGNKTLYYPSAKLLSDMAIDDYEKFQAESEFCKKLQDLLLLKQEDEKN